MSIHFKQPTQQYSLSFMAIEKYDECFESPKLEVRRQRKKKVVRMQDMHNNVSPLEGFSDQTKKPEFCTLVESPLTEGKSVSAVDMLSAMSSSVDFEYVDLDDLATDQTNEHKECDLSPTKQYKEQNVVPRAVLNQCEALEKAMERRNSKQSLLSYLLW